MAQPTSPPTQKKRKNMLAWGIGFFSCQIGASLLFIYGGMGLVRIIEPAVRNWHVVFQFLLYAFMTAVLLIVGWVIPRITICKIPWIAKNF